MSRGADGVATQAETAMAQLSTYARPRFEDDAAVAHANLTRDADATSAALHSLPNLPDRQRGGFLETMRGTVERGRLDPMTAAVKAVIEQAMQLSPEERAEVANALDGMSADAPALSPDDLAAAWRPELDRRREELERGEVQTVDAREAIAGIRARLRSGT